MAGPSLLLRRCSSFTSEVHFLENDKSLSQDAHDDIERHLVHSSPSHLTADTTPHVSALEPIADYPQSLVSVAAVEQSAWYCHTTEKANVTPRLIRTAEVKRHVGRHLVQTALFAVRSLKFDEGMDSFETGRVVSASSATGSQTDTGSDSDHPSLSTPQHWAKVISRRLEGVRPWARTRFDQLTIR